MATKLKLPKAPTGLGLGSAALAPAKPKAQPFAGIPVADAGLVGQAVPSPQPIDPTLANTQLIGNRNIAIGRGEAAYQQGNLGFDYGYNPDGSVNTANPYSRAALLMLGHEDAVRGTSNSYAARGQLYSTALGRAQGRNDFNYGAGEAANRLAYQRGTHGIQAGLLSTVANAGTAVSEADWQGMLRASYPGS